MRTKTIEIDGAHEQLIDMRDGVRAFLVQMNIPEDTVRKVTLGVDEACSNIIKHGYGSQCDSKPIRLDLSYEAGPSVNTLRIEIYDKCEAIEPSSFKGRRLEDVRPGGLGIHLIQSIMDEVRYERYEGGNKFVLTKNIMPPQEAVMKPIEISVNYHDLVDPAEACVATVNVGGEVDMNSSPDLRSYFTEVLKKRVKAIIVDLSEVRYMDSSGIATLVEVLQKIKRSDTDFKLAGLSPAVRDIFQLARLETVFTILDNVEVALRDYKLKA